MKVIMVIYLKKNKNIIVVLLTFLLIVVLILLKPFQDNINYLLMGFCVGLGLINLILSFKNIKLFSYITSNIDNKEDREKINNQAWALTMKIFLIILASGMIICALFNLENFLIAISITIASIVIIYLIIDRLFNNIK